MGKDSIRSSMTDVVAGDTPMPGGSLYQFNIEDKPSPMLKSSEGSLGFPTIDMSGIGEDIPGGLITCIEPMEQGDGSLDSSMGTKPLQS